MMQTDARTDTSLSAAARSSRSIVWTQALRVAVRVAGTVTLARLVAPRDYGIFGMAATVHGLAYVFQDFGLATITIRKFDLAESDRNTLFWLNLALGGMLTVLVGLAGIGVASFFGEPSLRLLLPFMATSFVVNGLHTQLRAQLARDHRFTDLNHIEIGAFSTSTLIGVAVAVAGGGMWALAAMTVSAEVALAVGVWTVQRWRPARVPGLRAAFQLLPTGAGLSANDGFRYVQRNVDLFLVGRWLGAGPLGIYGRAAQVILLPVIYIADPLANLAISTLRHLSQAPEAFRDFWRRLLKDLAWVTMPAAALFAVVPTEILHFLLGERWVAGAGVLAGLAIGVAFLPIQMACAWLFLSTGGTKRLLSSSFLNAALVASACLSTRRLGIDHIALGVGLSNACGAVASLAFIRRGDAVSAFGALKAVARPLCAAAFLAVALVVALKATGAGAPAARLGASAVVTCMWMGAIWFGWPGARKEWLDHFLIRG
jgi:PST family polysaccharide transporter